jgi:nicotinate-nucleotide adenylyltransferase
VPRLGILGGTFDPPHVGHLAVARAALAQLPLARVLLMPVNRNPFKGGAPDPGPRERLEMCRLAAAGEERVEACGLEIERGGASFTVDTLRAIHASHPDVALTFILGADTAATLPSWREPRALAGLTEFAVAARGGTVREHVLQALAPLAEELADDPANGLRVTFLDMPEVDVSASEVRRRIAAGEPFEELVGPAVAGYIAEHRLYGYDGEAPR